MRVTFKLPNYNSIIPARSNLPSRNSSLDQFLNTPTYQPINIQFIETPVIPLSTYFGCQMYPNQAMFNSMFNSNNQQPFYDGDSSSDDDSEHHHHIDADWSDYSDYDENSDSESDDEPVPTPSLPPQPNFESLNLVSSNFNEVSDVCEAICAPTYAIHGFKIDTHYPRCRIVKHPNHSDKAFLAIPNVFYYDMFSESWLSPFCVNPVFDREFPELAQLPFENFQQTELKAGDLCYEEDVYRITHFPNPKVVIGGGNLQHFRNIIRDSQYYFENSFSKNAVDDTIYFPLVADEDGNVRVEGLDNIKFNSTLFISEKPEQPDDERKFIPVLKDAANEFSNVISLLTNPFVETGIKTEVLRQWTLYNCDEFGNIRPRDHHSPMKPLTLQKYFLRITDVKLSKVFETMAMEDNVEFQKCFKAFIIKQFGIVLTRRQGIERLHQNPSRILARSEPPKTNDPIKIGPTIYKIYDNFSTKYHL